jgi:hypothetical protein
MGRADQTLQTYCNQFKSKSTTYGGKPVSGKLVSGKLAEGKFVSGNIACANIVCGNLAIAKVVNGNGNGNDNDKKVFECQFNEN